MTSKQCYIGTLTSETGTLQLEFPIWILLPSHTLTRKNMSSQFVPADATLSQRLLDQHDVVVDALGGQLLLFPFDLSKENIQVLESGCADGQL
jgi:hypothetical protein